MIVPSQELVPGEVVELASVAVVPAAEIARMFSRLAWTRAARGIAFEGETVVALA